MIIKTTKYKHKFNHFVWFCYRYRKTFHFLNDRRSLSKTHAYFFWHIYDGYNYGKRIDNAYAYNELMSLEGTPLKAIISIHRLVMVDSTVQSFYLSNPLKVSFLYRVLSGVPIKIVGEHKIKIKYKKMATY